ncbi:MAG: DMT family transporter [Sphingomonas sp.]
MTAAAPDRAITAIVLRLGAAFVFAAMGAMIKLAEAGGAHLAEILFFRQTFALLPVTLWIAAGPGLGTLRTQRFGAHVLRTAMGLTSMCFVFITILLLPLAESTTMQFTLPIFATILGAVVLREPTGVHRWGAVVAGFFGVLIITQPGSVSHMPLIGVATGLTGALLSASVSILLRQIGRTEGAATTVFWFSALSVPVLVTPFALFATPHPASTWLWLALVGVFGGCAQLLMTASLRFGAVSLVVPMDYTGLVWATMFGWVVFNALPTSATLLGAPILIGSGLYIVWREHRLQRMKAAQAIA